MLRKTAQIMLQTRSELNTIELYSAATGRNILNCKRQKYNTLQQAEVNYNRQKYTKLQQAEMNSTAKGRSKIKIQIYKIKNTEYNHTYNSAKENLNE